MREAIRKEDSIKRELKIKIAEVSSAKVGNWKQSLKEIQADLKKSDIRVSILNRAINLAKKFGDAFAWLFFKGYEKRIRALSANQPNPDIPTEISLKAMLAVAENFYRGGAGFSIIHDITNYLRIGDITFCNIVDDEDEPLTVEVKAKTLSIEGNTANLSVSIYADAVQPQFTATVEELNKIAGKMFLTQPNESKSNETIQKAKSNKPNGFDERFKRQARRMSKARKLQNIKHGDRIKHNEKKRPPTLGIGLTLNRRDFHWKILNELLIEAKKSGFASRSVDDAFLYTVTYSDKPITHFFEENGELPSSDELSEAVKEIPMCKDSVKNQIYFATSLEYFSDELAPHLRPFFWYEIPKDFILDILWGRMLVNIIVNVGKIVEALEENGINARVPRNEAEFASVFIPITTQFTISTGAILEAKVFGLKEFADKIGYEFFH